MRVRRDRYKTGPTTERGTFLPDGYRIGVFSGGLSSERDVSLKSGKAVYDCFKAAGADVVNVDVKTEKVLPVIEREDIDVVFLALHGRFGEDGAIQQLLDRDKIPYTGSGPGASALAMDKAASKEKFRNAGLHVPGHVMVRRGDSPLPPGVEFPCVVKPRHEGSSVGISVVRSAGQLGEAVERACVFGEDIILEEFIPGREMTVGILAEEALPVTEIVAPGGIYDFDAKYRSPGTVYVTPAEVGPVAAEILRSTALRAHKALGCRCFSRVDIRLGEDGVPYVLEVNTIPGLTERSLLPMAAKAAGFDFLELCVKMVHDALRRYTR